MKVYVVSGGCWDTSDYDNNSYETTWTICDSFSSACNYIRKELTKNTDEMRKRYEVHYKDVYASFDEFWKSRRFTYGPDELPSDYQLACERFVYRDYLCGEELYFSIEEHEVEHYE